MNIFISNDDGIDSLGLKAIANKLSEQNKVLVIAPDGNRSASSHSLTLKNSIKLAEQVVPKNKYKAYSITGTPADCVKFAKHVFSEFNTDYVVSGINKGHNLGSDILYSGTVSIACEASFYGDIAFAVSAYNLDDGDYITCSEYVVKIIDLLLPMSQKGDIWNINFPDNDVEIKGVKVTQLGRHIYSDKYVEISPNEFVLEGEPKPNDCNDLDCDIVWCEKGYITITPILFNKTNYVRLNEVKEKCEELL